jgi:hypothetical protein
LHCIFFGSFSLTSVAQTNKGFIATRSLFAGGSPYASAAGDLNHDGIPDIVVADGTNTTIDSNGVYHRTVAGIAVLIGEGNGNFMPAVHYPTVDSASFICLVDVNGDGNLDAITASYDPANFTPGGSMEVLLGRGDGTFAAPVKYNAGSTLIEAVFPGDFNGDGHVDLAVQTLSIGSNIVQGLAVFLNNGDGTFRLGQQTPNDYPLGVADFDRDGKLDLVVGHYSSGGLDSVNVLFGAGNGTFTRSGPSHPIASGTFEIADAAIADFNEDGFPDIALVNNTTTLTLLLGSADGTLTQAPNRPSLDGGWSITVGDFNHDGHMDIATVTGEYESEVDVLLGNGDGTFSYRTQYGTDGAFAYDAHNIAAADLNGDGYLDLLTVNPSGTVSPLYGKPGGVFNAEVSTGPGWIGSDAIATGDFNRDGIPDTVVLYSPNPEAVQSSISVFTGTTSGHFKPLGTHYATGTTGTAFAVGDVNGDGKLDVVVVGDGTNNLPQYSLLLGNGDGTFQAARIMKLTAQNSGAIDQVLLADVNNDGKLDIVTLNGVSLGNGDGTFQQATPLFANDQFFGQHFALGDFNNDGKPDLAAISDDAPEPQVTIHLGYGNGTFNPTASATVTLNYGDYYRNYIALGRFTTNGALGVVTASVEQDLFTHTVAAGAITLIGGNGDGTLMAPATYQLPADFKAFAIADFNGDGIDDVAAVSQGSAANVPAGDYSTLSYFTSAGSGTLNPGIDFGAGQISEDNFSDNIRTLAVADFNGDGAPDIAGLNFNSVGLILNSSGDSVGLAATPNPAAVGHTVTLKATVSASFYFSGTTAAGATVTFYDGSIALATVPVSSGVAQTNVLTFTPGTHTLTAKYSGNAYYEPKGSNTVREVVNP